MDIKEIAKRIRKTNNSYMLSMSPDIASEFAEALVESYKAELLKEVTSKDVLGEPVAWLCWLDGDTELLLRDAALVRYEPLAYRNRRPLYTSDQVAAAILKATKPLEDQLAAAQEENGRLENQVLKRDAELWGRTQEILGLKDQFAKAEQRVAEACSAYMLNKNYNSLEFDRKYSAKEFCAGQKSTVEFLAKMIRSGEWRNFVKEV